ncbi:MAG: hypothetical protein AAF735_01165 [Myxococcota bacterium]
MIGRPLLSLASCSILLHAACGEDSTEVDVAEPNYLVATGLLAPDGVSGLVFFLEGLGSDFVAEPEEALEIPGGAFAYAIPGTAGFVVVGQSEPELTRYDFRSDGTVAEGSTLSLANFGIQPGIRTVRALDAEEGWVSADGQLFEFNPTTMTITRDIQLEGLDRPGTFGPSDGSTGTSFVGDDEIFFSYGWFDESAATLRDEVALVHVDRITGEHSVSFLDGCGDIADGFVDESGDLWLGSWSYVIEAVAFAGTEAIHSCLIKVPAGSTTLDDAEVTDLTALVGAPAGALLPLGAGNALIRVADDSLNTEVDTIDEVRSQAAFGWARIDLNTFTVTPTSDLPLSTASTGAFPDGAEQIIAVTAEDFSNTVLYRVDGSSATAGVSAPGFFINGVAR